MQVKEKRNSAMQVEVGSENWTLHWFGFSVYLSIIYGAVLVYTATSEVNK